MEQKLHNRGGARPNAGRPKKDDSNYGKIHCVLRKDTILALRQGCGGKEKQYGQFLQDHLDEHPLPDRETYLFKQKIKQSMANGWRPADPEHERYIRALRRQERQRLRQAAWEKRHPKEAKWKRSVLKTLNQIQRQEKAKATAKA